MAGASRLKAGQKSAVTARIATELKQGEVTEAVEVLTNDPRRPKVVLTLRARVLGNITIPPPQAPAR
jgi:hypothetical protein